MARSMSVQVLKIDELSQSARDAAFYNWLESAPYGFDEDDRQTLKIFEERFPVQVRSWSYGDRGEHIRFVMTCEEDIEDLKGIRLLAYLWNNYKHVLYGHKTYILHPVGTPNNKRRVSKIKLEADCELTGYCRDEDILGPIYRFMKKPDLDMTFKELMTECMEAWLQHCKQDWEESTTQEYFEDEARENDWEFFEDGQRVYN